MVSTGHEYDEALRERHANTCSWIFGTPAFSDWQIPPLVTGETQPNVLWIHGGPGTGKTFLSASIVQFMKQRAPHPVAYFFCRHDDAVKNNLLSILRSWIVQLASQSLDALEVIKNSKAENEDATQSRLWKIFLGILGSIPCCYLIVDGFDECLDYDPTARARRTGVMELFLKQLLKSTRPTRAKLLLISRDQPAIRSGLTSSQPLPIEYPISPQDTADDIKSIAHQIVDSIKIGDEATRTDTFNQLSSGCRGMFL